MVILLPEACGSWPFRGSVLASHTRQPDRTVRGKADAFLLVAMPPASARAVWAHPGCRRRQSTARSDVRQLGKHSTRGIRSGSEVRHPLATMLPIVAMVAGTDRQQSWAYAWQPLHAADPDDATRLRAALVWAHWTISTMKRARLSGPRRCGSLGCRHVPVGIGPE
jgi:hypothetical protein